MLFSSTFTLEMILPESKNAFGRFFSRESGAANLNTFLPDI